MIAPTSRGGPSTTAAAPNTILVVGDPRATVRFVRAAVDVRRVRHVDSLDAASTALVAGTRWTCLVLDGVSDAELVAAWLTSARERGCMAPAVILGTPPGGAPRPDDDGTLATWIDPHSDRRVVLPVLGSVLAFEVRPDPRLARAAETIVRRCALTLREIELLVHVLANTPRSEVLRERRLAEASIRHLATRLLAKVGVSNLSEVRIALLEEALRAPACERVDARVHNVASRNRQPVALSATRHVDDATCTPRETSNGCDPSSAHLRGTSP